MNTIHRLLVILFVVLIPLALLHETLMHMATNITFARFIQRIPRLLSPLGFGLVTVWLGLIIYPCVCWFKKSTRIWFFAMLLACTVLGSSFIWFLRMAFFFSMPGDGPIP